MTNFQAIRIGNRLRQRTRAREPLTRKKLPVWSSTRMLAYGRGRNLVLVLPRWFSKERRQHLPTLTRLPHAKAYMPRRVLSTDYDTRGNGVFGRMRDRMLCDLTLS